MSIMSIMTKLMSHDARYEEVMPYLAPNPPITIILFKYVKKISNFKTKYMKVILIELRSI